MALSPSAIYQAAASAFRAKPSISPDNEYAGLRASRYGDQMVANLVNSSHALADEGSYFNTTNPTIGTGIALTTSITAFGATTPSMIVKNGASISDPNAPRVYLDYLRLICTSVPTSATAWDLAIITDQAGANRYTSGGSALVPVNANADTAVAAQAQVYFGALVAAAAVNARITTRAKIRTVVPVAGDEYLFKFGTIEGNANYISSTAGAISCTVPCGPLVLGPGEFALFYMFGASNGAAPAFEFELGHWER